MKEEGCNEANLGRYCLNEIIFFASISKNITTVSPKFTFCMFEYLQIIIWGKFGGTKNISGCLIFVLTSKTNYFKLANYNSSFTFLFKGAIK